MNTETITINKTPYKIAFSFKAIKLYEELTRDSISNCTSTWQQLLYFYCTLKALNNNFEMELEQFTEYMDLHPEIMIQWQTSTAETSQEPTTTQPTDKKKQNPLELWMLFGLLAVLPILAPVIFGALWIWQSLKLLVWHIAKVGKKRAE